jgi:hypothetical protein
MADLADKIIAEDITTLRQAYQLRQREYEALRAAGEWAGAIMHAGILLELALKIAICKNMDVTNLPKAFQIHDLKLLLYCTGLRNTVMNNPELQRNFGVIATHWTMDLRYKGAVVMKQYFDEVHQALFDPSTGILTFLSTFL